MTSKGGGAPQPTYNQPSTPVGGQPPMGTPPTGPAPGGPPTSAPPQSNFNLGQLLQALFRPQQSPSHLMGDPGHALYHNYRMAHGGPAWATLNQTQRQPYITQAQGSAPGTTPTPMPPTPNPNPTPPGTGSTPGAPGTGTNK